MKDKIVISSIGDYPEVPASWGGMLWNETGSWRFARPVFSERPSPCSLACPLGNDIPNIMHLLKEGDHTAAKEALMWEDPFPAVLGRVCPAFCVSECNRKDYDEAVGIRDVERYLGDTFFDKKTPIPKKKNTKKGIGIVGAGPAGLSAAYFLYLLGYDVTIFERDTIGGILTVGIPEYRLPRGVVESVVDLVRGMGVDIREKIEVGKDIKIEGLKSSFDALFVAPGAHVSRLMDIPGEEIPGVISGLGFLRDFYSGKSKEIKGKVAIIGGGNTALDCARVIKRIGAKPTVIYRRGPEEMPAFYDEITEASHEKIPIEFLKAPVEISKTGKGKIIVKLVKMELGDTDSSGRRKPSPAIGTEHEIEVDGVISAVGEDIDLSFLDAKAKGEIESLKEENIYIGGDANGTIRSVAHAAASGKRVAMEIDLKLEKGIAVESDDVFKSFKKYYHNTSRPVCDPVSFSEVNTDYFEHVPGVRAEHLDSEVLTKDFSEINLGYTKDEAKDEASRCFMCGKCIDCGTCELFCPDFSIIAVKAGIEIDYDYCKGCGICAKECPRGVITIDIE
jgi:NADPH-dependent glutamate synthase beta subunit-like oxidoreductase